MIYEDYSKKQTYTTEIDSLNKYHMWQKMLHVSSIVEAVFSDARALGLMARIYVAQPNVTENWTILWAVSNLLESLQWRFCHTTVVWDFISGPWSPVNPGGRTPIPLDMRTLHDSRRRKLTNDNLTQGATGYNRIVLMCHTHGDLGSLTTQGTDCYVQYAHVA